ncbi:MAG: radical SAM protein, partial [Lachnospiraceae bacterium]|nr:radical SAM protein [Lachnospiraceae bacterium]
DMNLWGIPLNEKGEKKLHNKLISTLKEMIDEETLIGFSLTANYEILHALPAMKLCKETFKNKIILGGSSATTCYKFILDNYHKYVDAVCLGAGELTWKEIIENFKGNEIDYTKVHNLVYWENGTVVQTSIQKPLNFDDIPPINYEPLCGTLEKYISIAFNTSRGCAWHCEFCQEKKLYPQFSSRSVDKVKADLQNLKDVTNQKLLMLSDPLFGLDYQSCSDIVKVFNSMGYEYQFGTRCDVFHEKLYEEMGENCRLIFFGFESASPERLIQMLKTKKPEQYLENMLDQIERCFKNNIFATMGIMINYPRNTKADLNMLIEYNEKIKERMRPYSDCKGYLLRAYPFYIYYGDYYQSILEELEKEGVTHMSVYPIEYHGISIPENFELEIHNSSFDLNVEELYDFWNKIHGMSGLNNDECVEVLRGFYGPNLTIVKDSKLYERDLFVDEDILDLSNIIENLDTLNEKYPEYRLKDARGVFLNPFRNYI